MIGDWTLTIRGVIEGVDKEDVDKSGRGKRHFLTFHVRPDEPPAVPAGATVPAVIPVRIKDLDLERITKTPPGAGARVELSARAHGAAPASFYLTALRPA